MAPNPKENGCGALSKSVPVVDVANLTPETFWKDYVSQRQAVRIRGHFTDATWTASARWTLPYLKEQAGDSAVIIESRDPITRRFGAGIRKRSSFGAFLDQVAAGDSSVYLSSCEPPIHPEDGRPEVLAPPLSSVALRKDFPLRPDVVGHLIPQQINLWMGAPSKEGSSSGLHHDFHDNIYVLLHGRKRFRIFPPKEIQRLYTYGRPKKVYGNGRIVYEGQGDVLEDGAEASEVKLWRRRYQAEREVAAAESDVAVGNISGPSRLKAALAKLEEVEEAELEELLDEDEEGEEDEDEDEDEDEGEEESDSDNPTYFKSTPKSKSNSGSKSIRIAAGSDLDDPTWNPPSFSRVSLRTLDEHMRAKGGKKKKNSQTEEAGRESDFRKEFPNFPSLEEFAVCDVEAGEMLFLPAGWFHEVESFGSSNPNDRSSSATPPPDFHMALNYWFHPPSNLDPRRSGFTKPYKSGFFPALWRRRWAESKQRVEAAAAAIDERSNQIETTRKEERAKKGGDKKRKRVEEEEKEEEGAQEDSENVQELIEKHYYYYSCAEAEAEQSRQRAEGEDVWGSDDERVAVEEGEEEEEEAEGKKKEKRVDVKANVDLSPPSSETPSAKSTTNNDNPANTTVSDPAVPVPPVQRPSEAMILSWMARMTGLIPNEKVAMAVALMRCVRTREDMRFLNRHLQSLTKECARIERCRKYQKMRVINEPMGRRHHMPAQVSCDVRRYRPSMPKPEPYVQLLVRDVKRLRKSAKRLQKEEALAKAAKDVKGTGKGKKMKR